MLIGSFFSRKVRVKIKDDKQILKEKRANKLRQIEGEPLVWYGSEYEYRTLVDMHSLNE